MKKILLIFIILIVCVLVLFSIIKFSVWNPISSFCGMIQILYTDKEYTIVQRFPKKIILAKPGKDILDKYMEKRGFIFFPEEQMGSMLVYKNGEDIEVIFESSNMYYSKWEWNE